MLRMYAARLVWLVSFSSLAAAGAPRDPSAVFAEIDTAIAAQDYYKGSNLLGTLMNDLLAVGVSPPTGAAHREATDRGRDNRDVNGLARDARRAWDQAARNEQPWAQAMNRLLMAFSSAVYLDLELPPAVRYEQARARYEADGSGILLHQLMLRAFEADEYADAARYVVERRKQIPRAFPGASAGPILHRLETLAGVVALKLGNVEGAVEALARSAEALKQVQERRLDRAPSMRLAHELLRIGQMTPVIAFLDVCAEFSFPDEGERAPARLKAAILAGQEPRFDGMLEID